jgi:hypothetical protein
MSTVKIHVPDFSFDDTDDGEKVFEYDGENVDVQLSGENLVVVEYVPDLEKADGTKKANLLAIHKVWDYVEVI